MANPHDDHDSLSASGPSRPVDAASVIVFDDAGGDLRVLMGQRGAGNAFMPNRFVFPGGRVERDDRTLVLPDTDGWTEPQRLKLLVEMKGRPSPARANGLGLAAVRECFEEAGVVIGRPDAEGVGSGLAANITAQPPETTPLAQMSQLGYRPRLTGLTYFARAITPPGRTRRFDARFFCIERASLAAETSPLDEELGALEFYRIDDLKRLNLAPITRSILADFTERLDQGPLENIDLPVPFYYQIHGSFRRDLIAGDDATVAQRQGR